MPVCYVALSEIGGERLFHSGESNYLYVVYVMLPVLGRASTYIS